MTRTAARTRRSLVLGAVAALIAGGLGLAPGGVAVAAGQVEPEEVVRIRP
ncbi:hypothetical protein [Streptomyces sp. NBC_01481]|nr:hypothetical protein [Streptomyces sp. NBC_01481]MCX4584324.1 hypothetical protein [Streptomyces sp. NBC_01481]